MARRVEIRQPIWKDKSIGIAEYKMTDDLEITIPYVTKEGERLFPYVYFISRSKAMCYPKQLVKGIILRIIPIADLEVRREAL